MGFEEEKCDQQKIIQISQEIVKGFDLNKELLLTHFGFCFRQLGLISYFEDANFNLINLLIEDLKSSPENWPVKLSKLKDKVYYLKVQGTPLNTIKGYFNNVYHKINDLKPGLLETILNDYEKHIRGGFGLEIASLQSQEIKYKIQEYEIRSDKYKVIALIRLALMRRQLLDEEKQENQENEQTLNNDKQNQTPITPHHTQMITLMAVAILCTKKGDNEIQQGILAQVQTGQGKSIAAFYSIYNNEKVDIITSNESLAQRDFEQMELFYERLGLTSSYYQQSGYTNDYDVIYCTIKSILSAKAAICRKIAAGQQFEQRNQQCFIGDEVDQFLGKPEAATYNSLGKELTELNWICEFLFQNRDNLDRNQLKDAIQSDQKYSRLSNNAKEFVDTNIKNYIHNVKQFKIKWKINDNYTVKNGRIGYKDKISNTYCYTTSMGDCIQQFIQLKEQIQMSPITLIQASISYEEFIKQYERNVGLSGTIGTEEERKELNDVFKLTSFDAPRFEGNAHIANLKILPAILAEGNTRWTQEIILSASKASNNGQPVLIVIEAMNELFALNQAFITQFSPNLIQTLQGNENFKDQEKIIEQAGDVIQGKGRITLGLEIAGRGIDIKPMKVAENKGGLKVILGFIPSKVADEVQVQGRTSRQTNKGEFQYIVDKTNDTYKKFLVKYNACNNDFKKALELYRNEIQTELCKERTKNRAHNTFIHEMCEEFFLKLQAVSDQSKKQQIVNNWSYFLELMKYYEVESDLAIKNQKKNQFYIDNPF